MHVVVGVDIGSITAKAVVLNEESEVLAKELVHQGVVNKEAARRCLDQALSRAGVNGSSPLYIVTTGYGRQLVDFGDRSITEITCHAKGVHAVLPEIRTVIDVGGQDSKVIAVDDAGAVLSFRMNDKCAAGTGRFLEEVSKALEVDLEEFGDWALRSEHPAQVSSTCTVFAESEIISLSARGIPKVDIIGGLHHALGRRLTAMARAVGIREPVAMTGGVAKNVGMRHVLEELLGTEIILPQEPQLTGALGAALVALQSIKGADPTEERRVARAYKAQRNAPQPACPCPMPNQDSGTA